MLSPLVRGLVTAALLTAMGAFAQTQTQTITTPMFVWKDGWAVGGATPSNNGTATTMKVDGGATRAVAWADFVTGGIDRASITKATLNIFVSSVSTIGQLKVYNLTADISSSSSETGVTMATLGTKYNPASTPIATRTFSSTSGDNNKVISLDITAAVKGASFFGVALASDNGLVANFGTKESPLAPTIYLTYDNSGDIKDVTVGAGLAGGGSSGSVMVGIAEQGVTGTMIAPRAIGSDNMRQYSVVGEIIAPAAVTSDKVAGRAVKEVALDDGAVSSRTIATRSVKEVALDDGAVTSRTIASRAVTSVAIAPAAIRAEHISDFSVNTPAFAANAVSTFALADDAVTSAKIADITRTLYVSPYSLMYDDSNPMFAFWYTTGEGLSWAASSYYGGSTFNADGHPVIFNVYRPDEFAYQGNVVVSVFYHKTSNDAAPVSFMCRRSSADPGDNISMGSGVEGVPQSGGTSSTLFKETFTFSSADLLKTQWRFELYRRHPYNNDLYPDPVIITGVYVAYQAKQ